MNIYFEFEVMDIISFPFCKTHKQGESTVFGGRLSPLFPAIGTYRTTDKNQSQVLASNASLNLELIELNAPDS